MAQSCSTSPASKSNDYSASGDENISFEAQYPKRSPLDQRYTITVFKDKQALQKRECLISPRGMQAAVTKAIAPEKALLPLWKLASFGNQVTEKGSLRHNANLIAISGIEVDYDGEVIPVQTAVDILKAARVVALVYPSPSHTPAKPRWRVLCFCSAPMDGSRRAGLVARLNGLFDGKLAGESFTLSQSYYFGRLPGNTDAEATLIDGRFVDECDELDATAVHKRPSNAATGDIANIPPIEGEGTEDGLKALARYCAEITHAPDGEKHAVINRASFSIGGLVASGSVSKATAEAALSHALESLRDRCENFADAITTKDRAFADGLRKPLAPDLSVDAFAAHGLEPSQEPEEQPTAGKTEHKPDPAAWRDLLIVKNEKTHEYYANDYNAAIILRHSPQWKGRVAYNEFNHSYEVDGRPMVDNDAMVFLHWVQAEADIPCMHKHTAFDALVAVAQEHKYNPVLNLLAGLKHDGISRIDTWLIDCAGAEDTPLNRAYSKKFLIGMVARVREPGCKLDNVLILEGKQGIRKSTLFATLAFRKEWFTDNLGDISKKDAPETMAGKWLIEMSELDSLSRKDSTQAKAFLSRDTDRFRPAYGRIANDFKRQNVFCGTVNPGADGYLKDETGARRYWPVLCGVNKPDDWKIDIEWLQDNREQLLAEAVDLYEAGTPWYLETGELEELQRESAKERNEIDPWTDSIERYIDDKEYVKITEVLTDALQITMANQTQTLSNRVGRTLRVLGWIKTTKRIEVELEDGTIAKKVSKVFVPPKSHKPRKQESVFEAFSSTSDNQDGKPTKSVGNNVRDLVAHRKAKEAAEAEMARLLA